MHYTIGHGSVVFLSCYHKLTIFKFFSLHASRPKYLKYIFLKILHIFNCPSVQQYFRTWGRTMCYISIFNKIDHHKIYNIYDVLTAKRLKFYKWHDRFKYEIRIMYLWNNMVRNRSLLIFKSFKVTSLIIVSGGICFVPFLSVWSFNTNFCSPSNYIA